MTLAENVKEVTVRLRRGVQKVDIYWDADGKSATWRDGAWVPGADAPDAIRADLRAVGTWLTRTVGKAEAEASD